MAQISENTGRPGKVLISGGSGLIGRYLTSMLLERGYSVSHLSRSASQFGRVRVFRWNPEMGILDASSLRDVNYIIHLAGAGIGDKRWTESRKKEIIDSRVLSAELIHKTITDEGLRPEAFITASGAGYYGAVTSDTVFSENDPPSGDFLGITTKKWEEAASLFESDGIRTVKIRTAVVLEKNDSALVKITMPAKFGFLSTIGKGNQYMPWIHIKDLCRIYIKAIEDENMSGAFNAAAKEQVTHKEFMKILAKVLKIHLLPAVPSLAIKAMYGEMADVVLKGSRISSEKIRKAGFEFEFDDLKRALEDIYREVS
ncbi:MAG TPA: TIGR01777 family oxidoreductase [Bacteroidales bacterium]|nr:TIGR01777 family oxidoreductase [Bacteroidales bacterium]